MVQGYRGSVGVDFEVNIDLGAVVELADGLGIALLALVLGIDFVVHRRGERRKAVGAVYSDNIGLNGPSAGIGDVDDGVGKRVVLRIEHFAEEQTADGLLFLVGRSSANRAERKE